MAQGQAYKVTLLSQIDRVRDLIFNVDREAAVSSQYRLRNLERICQEQLAISRQLKEVKERQHTEKKNLEEAKIQELSTSIGEATVRSLINSLYSHFSSNPGIDPKIRGKP